MFLSRFPSLKPAPLGRVKSCDACRLNTGDGVTETEPFLKPLKLYQSFAPLVAVLAVASSFAAPAAYAQEAPPAPANPPTPATNPAPSVSDDRGNVIAKPIEFGELGDGIAKPNLKMPSGATSIRQVSAPFGAGNDTILLNVYKVNGAVFMDVLTSKNSQPWTPRNHIRLKSPLPLRPDKMALTLRFLEPQRKKSYLIVAADDAGILTFAFPKGIGGTVMQQQFLASTTSQAAVKRTYDFGQTDSRGFVIVKATVEGTGEIKPTNDVQFFVWNGKSFIPRKPN